MPTETVVNQVFSSTDFLLKIRQDKVNQIASFAKDLKFLFKQDGTTPSRSPITYMAIDGTESMDSRYDFVVFYAGAFGYAGQLIRGADGRLHMGNEASVGSPTEVSMAVPMHEGDAAGLLEGSQGSPTEIPALLMELSELALARSAVAEGGVDLLLLDRSLSLEYSHLFSDVSSLLASSEPALFDGALLKLALNTLPSAATPPRAGPQLAWQVLDQLERNRSSWSEIAASLKMEGKEELLRDSLSRLEEAVGEKIVEGTRLVPKFQNFEQQLQSSLDAALRQVLFSPAGHPLWKDGRWLSEGDVKSLSFMTLRSLLGLCYKNHTFAIGLIKQSSSTDVTRRVLKKFVEEGKLQKEPPELGSDTAFLEVVAEALGVETPWRTIEFGAGSGDIRGVFAKGYVKLSSSFLGRVFQYDRPLYSSPPSPDWVEGDGSWSGDGFSDYVLAYLEPMGMEAIPEALGYNYPLFLADKKAKTMQAEARRAYISAIELTLSKAGVNLPASGYRDMRRYYEQMRRRTVV